MRLEYDNVRMVPTMPRSLAQIWSLSQSLLQTCYSGWLCACVVGWRRSDNERWLVPLSGSYSRISADWTFEFSLADYNDEVY